MSTVTLTLTADTEKKLREKASQIGQSLETYLQQLAEQAVANGTRAGPTPQRTPGIDQWEGAIISPLSRREIYDDGD
jgi:hypothetical protein